MAEKQKRLSQKQQLALELLTSGKGMKFKEICEQVGIDSKTLYRWRHEPEFAYFQQKLEEINSDRWAATVDAAREGALKLCADGNQKMIEFILKNEGYNPSQKVEADVSGNMDININIEE